MICLILSMVIGAVIFAAISGLVLMLAHRLVLKESIEYGEAFKVMFFASLATQVVSLLLHFALTGGEHEYLLTLIPSIVLFCAVTYLLDAQAGLHLHQAAIVAIVMTVLWIGFTFALAAVLAIWATSAAG